MTRILTESARLGSAMALATSYRSRLPAPGSRLQRYDDRQWIEIAKTSYPWEGADEQARPVLQFLLCANTSMQRSASLNAGRSRAHLAAGLTAIHRPSDRGI